MEMMCFAIIPASARWGVVCCKAAADLNAPSRSVSSPSYNTGESRGRETSHSLNYQKLGKELMTVDELSVMDGGKCILQLRGVRPFLSDKYDITRHPYYKYLSDADPRNAFSVERFLSARLTLTENETYEVFHVDVSDQLPSS